MGEMERIINGELVREACSRAMFCPMCGASLDCDDAVLCDHESKQMFVVCGACYDEKASARGDLKKRADWSIIDGRTL